MYHCVSPFKSNRAQNPEAEKKLKEREKVWETEIKRRRRRDERSENEHVKHNGEQRGLEESDTGQKVTAVEGWTYFSEKQKTKAGLQMKAWQLSVKHLMTHTHKAF